MDRASAAAGARSIVFLKALAESATILETGGKQKGHLMISRATAFTVAFALAFGLPAEARQAADQGGQAATPTQQELAKQLSNPVADLVSVPVQFNWENGVGPDKGLRMVMNFQPVLPMKLTDDWNLIGRFILPVVGQPPLVEGGTSSFGTGDIVLSTFLSPSKAGRAIWGVGPVFTLPTTTNPFLGSGKWSIGPTAVVLKQTGPWTYGALVNHLWSYASVSESAKDRAEVNATFLQPFLAYATPTGVTYSVNMESTANWEAESGQKWTVPVNLQISKLATFGPFPFSMGASVGFFAAAPDGGPSWKLRATFTLLLPRRQQ